jgi:ergothioneine biosynthesis protein EgtB
MSTNSLPQAFGSQRAELAADFIRIRQATVDLTAGLDPEDCVIQTIPEVSPTKWHLAHTTWFFEQFCLLANDDSYRVFNDQFQYLFNSYYYSVGQMHDRSKRGLLNRPPLREVLAYRNHVDESMLDLIDRRGDDDEFRFVVTLGLNHEQQHQELLLTDIKHVFFTNPLKPAYTASPIERTVDAEAQRFLDRPGGRFEIGFDDRGFCFDNETPRHEVLLDEHQLANRPVTAGEFREFIADGGYRDPRLWMADGWARVRSDDWNRPLYWSEDLESEFTLSGWRDVDQAAPVCHVSQYEADACARWANARLPSEPEWELAANGSPIAGNTLDRGRFHPAPSTEPSGNRPGQLWGDVWEWTATPYLPYPKFKPLAGSLGEYNGKFMSNQIVVRGGSCASWAEHLRATYRSFFYPHDRWQFLGFRLARDSEQAAG